MHMAEKTPLAKWLENKYLEWMTSEGERKTVIEFADYLAVNRSLLSYWMNGSREPSEKNLIKLAFKLGFEIYGVMGKKLPNLLYLYASRNWDNVPPKVQRQLAETISKYSTEPIPNDAKENSTSKSK